MDLFLSCLICGVAVPQTSTSYKHSVYSWTWNTMTTWWLTQGFSYPRRVTDETLHTHHTPWQARKGAAHRWQSKENQRSCESSNSCWACNRQNQALQHLKRNSAMRTYSSCRLHCHSMCSIMLFFWTTCSVKINANTELRLVKWWKMS